MKGYGRRREGTRRQRKTVIIVCEGETEKCYFESFRTRYRYTGLVILPVHRKKNDPIHIIDLAIRKVEENDLEYEAGDRGWCVFDVDQNSDDVLREAFAKASRKNILIALSNPCIELWYILHFINRTAPLTANEAKTELKRFIKSYKKGQDICDKLAPGEKDAVKHAKGLNRQHERAGYAKNTRRCNPSSQVFEILEYFAKIARE